MAFWISSTLTPGARSSNLNPRSDAVVAAVHRVLHRIADDQQKHQIKRRHLPDLPLASDPQQQQDKGEGDNRPQDEFPPGSV